MKWNMIIEKVDNGYCLERPHPNEDEILIKEVFEIEEEYIDGDARKAECKALQKVLWTVIDEFCTFSDYNKYNLVPHIIEYDENGTEIILED